MKVKICVKNIEKWFLNNDKSIQILGRISFCIQKSSFVAILGPSGCGKSTLLNMIAGLESCEQGCITIDEDDIDQPERHRMMMFQEAALFPWLDAFGNVMYGLRFKKGLAQPERKLIALHYLKLVGLSAFVHTRVHELSGGMKQRVALARALAPNAQILLMDEPFSALDTLTCEQLYDDIQRIWNMQRKTILLVTHNIREAVVLAQRVIVLSPCPGKILKDIEIKLPYPRYLYDGTITEIVNQLVDFLRVKKNTDS